jgi:hypothetical protein
VWATAVSLASSTAGYDRVLTRPTKGPENVPAEGGKTLLQRPGMFSGGAFPRRAWEFASDATAAAFWA